MANRIRYDVPEVIVYLGESRAAITLEEGTLIERSYLHGEVIWKIVGGGRDGWYLVASDRWVRRHTNAL